MKSQSLWKFIFAGIAFLGLVSAAGSFAFAQSGGGDSPTAPTATGESADGNGTDDGAADMKASDFMAKLATNLGVSEDDLRAAVKETNGQIVDQWLADGRITEDEATKLKDRIDQSDGSLSPFGRGHFGHGPGFGGRLDIGSDLADFLGIGADEIHQAREDGQSLAQIAKANGKTRQELIDHIVGGLQDKLDQKVADGDIDQSRADEIAQNFKDNVGDMVDRTDIGGPDGPFHGGHGRFGDMAPEGAIFQPPVDAPAAY
ncbi:MAG: hypothetical protein WBD55_06330 [Dehalococcoidia bacterium]